MTFRMSVYGRGYYRRASNPRAATSHTRLHEEATPSGLRFSFYEWVACCGDCQSCTPVAELGGEA